jgi:hypothetical protein
MQSHSLCADCYSKIPWPPPRSKRLFKWAERWEWRASPEAWRPSSLKTEAKLGYSHRSVPCTPTDFRPERKCRQLGSEKHKSLLLCGKEETTQVWYIFYFFSKGCLCRTTLWVLRSLNPWRCTNAQWGRRKQPVCVFSLKKTSFLC